MGFSNIKTKSCVRASSIGERYFTKAIPLEDGRIQNVSVSVDTSVNNLPNFDVYSVENCIAAGINLEEVNPHVIGSNPTDEQLTAAVDSFIGSEDTSTPVDNLSNE